MSKRHLFLPNYQRPYDFWHQHIKDIGPFSYKELTLTFLILNLFNL